MTPQGASSAPGAFPRVMVHVIDDLPNCQMYLDDAEIRDKEPEGHVAQLVIFFGRFEQHNLKLSPSKSQIGATTVTFLGHYTGRSEPHP